MSENGTLTLSVFGPERMLIREHPVDWVVLTGAEGEIQVLPGHANMVGMLETGVFRYKDRNGTETSGFISTGFFEISGDRVKVMAETLELGREIGVERARTAQRKAEEALQKGDLDESGFRKYQLKLQRSLIRQQIAAKPHSGD